MRTYLDHLILLHELERIAHLVRIETVSFCVVKRQLRRRGSDQYNKKEYQIRWNLQILLHELERIAHLVRIETDLFIVLCIHKIK